jgi:hypothetical protein
VSTGPQTFFNLNDLALTVRFHLGTIIPFDVGELAQEAENHVPLDALGPHVLPGRHH